MGNIANIGDVLKYYRKTKKWSVSEVAARLNDSYGLQIAEKTIYGWESNQAHPTSDTLLCLCNLYEIDNVNKAFFESNDNTCSVEISKDEYRLLNEYRNHPAFQAAIRKLLDMPAEST